MNEQLIEIRIKAEKKQAYTNGVLFGLSLAIIISFVTYLFFSFI